MTDQQYVQRLLQGLRTRAYHNPKRAWGVVDTIAAESPAHAKFAANLCRQGYGHRPCAKVGLKTRPFHVVQTRKNELARVGRLLDGHRRLSARRY